MPPQPPAGTTATARGIAWPMTVLTSLFFMWGFLTVMNDVLVPHWKKVFGLDYSDATDVQLVFFGAYFIGSLAYYLLSRVSGDPIQRIGYKRASIIGLLISALACAYFIPASYAHVYALYLVGIFLLGLGFTLLQIAANPFVAIIGSTEGASSRLNLAQAFNSLGTTLAPLIGGWLVFEHFSGGDEMRYPYAIYAAVFLLLAAWVHFTPLPEPPHQVMARTHALRHPQLRWGMLAIFCYVGAEVAIGSFIINYLGSSDVLELPEAGAKHYLSLYWGGAMTGRFLGAIALSRTINATRRSVYLLLVATAMLLLLFALNASDRFQLKHIWPFAVLVLANLVAFLVAGPRPARTLGLFAVAAVLLVLASILTAGAWAMWAIIAVGLFNSIMWSNIFTLAIDGLKEDTSQGSALLVMMIAGGAAIPKLQGIITDGLAITGDPNAGLQLSFLLPVLCYGYLAWYGFKGSQRSTAA
jgi:FHS family L-fucose permease-like MFS transporter